MNGRIMDVYRRLHLEDEHFYIPHDQELSLGRLLYICERANVWRGQFGSVRKVFFFWLTSFIFFCTYSCRRRLYCTLFELAFKLVDWELLLEFFTSFSLFFSPLLDLLKKLMFVSILQVHISSFQWWNVSRFVFRLNALLENVWPRQYTERVALSNFHLNIDVMTVARKTLSFFTHAEVKISYSNGNITKQNFSPFLQRVSGNISSCFHSHSLFGLLGLCFTPPPSFFLASN